jgi:hypothetical protein
MGIDWRLAGSVAAGVILAGLVVGVVSMIAGRR